MKKEKLLDFLLKRAANRIGESNVNAAKPTVPGLAAVANKHLGTLSSEIGVPVQPVAMTEHLTGNPDLKSVKPSLNYTGSPVNKPAPLPQIAGSNPGINSAKLPAVESSGPKVSAKGFSQFTKLSEVAPQSNQPVSRRPQGGTLSAGGSDNRVKPYSSGEIGASAQTLNYPTQAGTAAVIDFPQSNTRRSNSFSMQPTANEENTSSFTPVTPPSVQPFLKPLGRVANTAGAAYSAVNGNILGTAKAVIKKEVPIANTGFHAVEAANRLIDNDIPGAVLEGAATVVPVVPDAIQWARDNIRNVNIQAEKNNRMNMRSREVQGSLKEYRNTGVVDVDGRDYVNSGDVELLGKLGFDVTNYHQLEKTGEVLDLYSYIEKVAGVPKAVARAVDKGEAFSGSFLKEMDYNVPKGYEVKGDLCCPREKTALLEKESAEKTAAADPAQTLNKERLMHMYAANDPDMRILSQAPVTDKDFLYHASGKKFDILDPKYNSKRSYGYEYTEPVVFAGDTPSSAFAANPTAEYQSVKDKMKESVYHRLIDGLTGRKALLGHTPGGYLYKLPASEFTRIDREDNELGKWNKSTEYVSHRPVKPVSVTPMHSTDVDAIPEYEYLGKDFVGEMPAQHYLKHAKDPKVIAAVKAWLANNREKATKEKTASEKPRYYHGSETGDIKKLSPQESRVLENKKAVFGTHDKDVALSFARRWRDSDIQQGSVDGKYYMREQYPGAFEKIFRGPGYVYELEDSGFKHDPRLTKFERYSDKDTHVLKKEHIADVLEALKKSKFDLQYHKEKTATGLKAVIIKGNPKYLNTPHADKFYNDVADHLKGHGYSVSFDSGEAHTIPESADLWVGHSCGAGRLKYAPAGTKTIALGDKGGINHIKDKSLSKDGPVPDKYHFTLSDSMKHSIDQAIGKAEKTGNALVVSGIHGDEPAGNVAADKLKSSVDVISNINRSGDRELDGKDPNRHFDKPTGSTLHKKLLELIESKKPSKVISLHEDDEVDKPYAYSSDDMASDVKKALRDKDTATSAHGDKTSDGVITKGKNPPEGSLEKALDKRDIPHTTIETPKADQDLSTRAKTHFDVVKDLLAKKADVTNTQPTLSTGGALSAGQTIPNTPYGEKPVESPYPGIAGDMAWNAAESLAIHGSKAVHPLAKGGLNLGLKNGFMASKGLAALGKAIPVGAAASQAMDTRDRWNKGDYPGAVISGIGTAGSVAQLIPHPVAKGVGLAASWGSTAANGARDIHRYNNRPVEFRNTQPQLNQLPIPPVENNKSIDIGSHNMAKAGEAERPGLWANIHAKKARGEKPAKPGDEAYPDKKQWDKLSKEAKGRCWEGYEPVPGKEAYSEDSCRPKASKNKDKEKKAEADHPLTSSNIKAVGYDKKGKELDVAFHSGGEYKYKDVPKSLFERIKKVKSPGKFFHKYIKKDNQYSFEKISARRIPKINLNHQPLLPGVTEWIKKQPFNHAEELFRQGKISAQHRDDIISGRLYELTKDKFKAMLDHIANTPPGIK